MPLPLTASRKRLIFAAFGLLSLAIICAIGSSRIFDKFNKNTLIQSAFGADLHPYIAKEKTIYSDGCLQFHGITKSHPLFLLYFTPIVAYIPQRKILVFGYAYGIGG